MCSNDDVYNKQNALNIWLLTKYPHNQIVEDKLCYCNSNMTSFDSARETSVDSYHKPMSDHVLSCLMQSNLK